MKHREALLVTVLLFVSAGGPCNGQDDYATLFKSSNQPISITSKKFMARNIPGGKEGVFEADVRVKQGDMVMACDKLVIAYDEEKAKAGGDAAGRGLSKDLQSVSGIRSITASGNVKIVQNERMATAGQAEFDNVKRTLILKGGPPRLWQGPDMIIGDTIIIYVDENRSEIRSNGDANIKMLIHPGKKKEEK
jgi:lipopolysaccharide export system protein LptA